MNTYNLNQINQEARKMYSAQRVQLGDMLQVAEAYEVLKSDHVVEARSIRWNHGNMKFETQVAAPDTDGLAAFFGVPAQPKSAAISFEPDQRAFEHVCAKLGNLPAKYLMGLPARLQGVNMNHHLRDYPAGKEWRVRAIRGEDGERARAVMSDKYHPVNNLHVLQMLNELVDNVGVGYKLIRPYITPNTLNLKILFGSTTDGQYGFGLEARNGEVGNWMLGVFGFIQRTSCTNSIVWNEQGWQHRHIGGSSAAWLKATFKEKAGHALGLAPDMIEHVVEKAAAEIPDISEVLRSICKKHNFTEQVRDVVLQGTEGQNTQMGVVNGLSYAAHAVPDLPHETRTNLEHLAGDLLMADDFFRVAHKRVNDEVGVLASEHTNLPLRFS